MEENFNIDEMIMVNPKAQKALAQKIKAEIDSKKTDAKNRETRTITSIKDVPQNELYTKNSIWRATNLNTMIEFELSGVNVDIYLGDNLALRSLLEKGAIDSFIKNGLFIQFDHVTY